MRYKFNALACFRVVGPNSTSSRLEFNASSVKNTVIFSASDRLHDFTVGLTNVPPTTTDGPEKSPHGVCLVYNGVFPATKKILTCDDITRGRYLFIQINGNDRTNEMLTLCEVEVYGTYLDTDNT